MVCIDDTVGFVVVTCVSHVLQRTGHVLRRYSTTKGGVVRSVHSCTVKNAAHSGLSNLPLHISLVAVVCVVCVDIDVDDVVDVHAPHIAGQVDRISAIISLSP